MRWVEEHGREGDVGETGMDLLQLFCKGIGQGVRSLVVVWDISQTRSGMDFRFGVSRQAQEFREGCFQSHSVRGMIVPGCGCYCE